MNDATRDASRRSGAGRDARPIGALIGAVLDPVCAKRGFASADLIGAWDEIVGARYAGATQPEKILWPRREGENGRGATLVVRVDAGMAIYLQHELTLVLDRVNAFLGFRAIGSIRIVQGPVERRAASAPRAEPKLPERAQAAIRESVGSVESEGLRDALERLGRAVYAASVERS